MEKNVINAKRALKQDYSPDLDTKYQLIGGETPVFVSLLEPVQSLVDKVRKSEEKLLTTEGVTKSEYRKIQCALMIDGTFDVNHPDLSLTVVSAVVRDFSSIADCLMT